jgi:2,5-diketo-D-gluconate reductase B
MNLPTLGLGTFRLEGEQAYESVSAALVIGYRLIDTAQMYNNEAEVGRAVADSGVPRGEVFVTTKIWPDNFTRLIPSLRESLQRLNLEQVDLTLLHWPAPGSGVPLAETLGALIEAQAQGLTRQIGVSNFNIELMKQAIAIAGQVAIATNQVELSPYLQNRKLADFARSQSVRVTSYMTLARGAVLGDRTLKKIAQRHGATRAQVALAWAMRLGYTVIPSSTRRENMQGNFESLKLKLGDEDMAQIAKLDQGKRLIDPAGLKPKWD